LHELLQQKGFQDIPASVVRTALDAMYLHHPAELVSRNRRHPNP